MKLINSIMEFYPEKLTALPPDLFSSLMRSIAFGAEHVSTDISRLAFEAIASLADQQIKTGLPGDGLGQALDQVPQI
jgi:hypothetical protein